MMKRRLAHTIFLGTALLLLVLLTACPSGTGGNNTPPKTNSERLSISAPLTKQTLSGTVAVAAAGIGGKAENLVFRLGDLEVQAAEDGTATLNTRALADGAYTLEASANVSGRRVSDSLSVTVMNELPSSGTVGEDGGALKSEAGSLAMVPPGAVDGSVSLSVADLSQEEILAEFGIDYEALGITFLGALDVEAEGAETSNLPLQVDLAGWAEAVQPGQGVLMFSLAPDADGDGVGELMMAAEAVATEDGSVITRPVPKTEVYGLETISGSSLGVQQTSSVRPGELFTLSTRGFLIGGALSNVARFEGAPDILARPTLAESSSFNPLMTLQVAAPALGAGTHGVRFENLSSGYLSDQVDISIGSLGAGDAETWNAFVAQSRTAIERLSSGRSELLQLAEPWLEALAASGSSTAFAMANNSALVSAANQDALTAIGSGYSAEQRALVWQHALLLDAIAISVPELEQSAADLAALLVVTVPEGATGTSGGLRTLQGDSGGGCLSPGSEIFGPTGMGSAPPPGGPGCGSSAGGGGAGGSNLSSQRLGNFGPVEGAIVRILRRGSGGRLSPFTALTDEAGYYFIPMIAEGEPFTVRAVDPSTGNTASADGVGVPLGQSVSVPLVFTPSEAEPGAPTASFTIRPVADERFEGTVYYEFDAGTSSDPDGEIEEYVWSFGGFSASVDWTPTVTRGYGRNGTYTIRLTVIDDEGKADTTTQELVIDDLPYDYWGTPPERVSVGADGAIPDQEVYYGFSISEDGRYITFTTEAGNLHPDDVNGLEDVYLKDMETGELELVSSGEAGMEVGSTVAMNADARYVAYEAQTVSGRNYGDVKMFIKDRQTGEVEEVANPDGFRDTYLDALSNDGRVVAFMGSTLNDPDDGGYVKNLETGAITRLGQTLDGSGYAVGIRISDLSADGRYVVFSSSDANLVENDTNEQQDVFVTDLETGETVRTSVAQDGTEGDGGSSSCCGSVISDDGRYVTFFSEATNFVANDGNDDDDVFVKDLVTGELELISANAFGEQGDWDSILSVISADGRYVAFGSYAGNLAPEMDPYDAHGGNCSLNMCVLGLTYVKDRQTGKVALVTVGLDDTLPNDGDQIEPIISADGRYIGFYSWASNLVENDTDDTEDYFRAENPLWEP